ncbi:hypothetical protein [Lacihabitans sp. CS3-21]|uniref:hypothetical protein n=1 Tax=Lacihabitans sp. CS3-21 TaxID=2487332 RepID=UPI0020CE5786|nr:hypothetical protein [Lacihabitans sp. CS3-21]MCP9747792.1 hypothetical protein [Lacihabitans sp. CS3-21]
MRNIFTILFLLNAIGLSAQQDFRKTYFPLINKAELHLVKQEYLEASQAYFSAFSLTKTPLIRDLYNATVCKLYQNDFEGGKLYLFKMAQRGVKAETLEQREIFEVGYNTESWKNFKPSYEQFFEPKELNDFLKYHFTNLDILRKMIFEFGAESFVNLPNGANPPTHAIKRKDFNAYFSNETTAEDRAKILKYSMEEVEKETKDSQATKEDIYNEAKEILLLIMENPMALYEGNSQVETFHTHDHDLFSFLSFFTFNRDRRVGRADNISSFMNETEQKYIDEKLQDAVYQGFLSPQVAISQSSEKEIPEKIKVTSFTLTIENSSECGKEFDDIENIRFLKKNVLTSEEQKEYKKIKDKYGLESLDDRFKKEVFGIDKNKYFILNTRSSVESSVVPNCEVAQKMLAGATIIQD